LELELEFLFATLPDRLILLASRKKGQAF